MGVKQLRNYLAQKQNSTSAQIPEENKGTKPEVETVPEAAADQPKNPKGGIGTILNVASAIEKTTLDPTVKSFEPQEKPPAPETKPDAPTAQVPNKSPGLGGIAPATGNPGRGGGGGFHRNQRGHHGGWGRGGGGRPPGGGYHQPWQQPWNNNGRPDLDGNAGNNGRGAFRMQPNPAAFGGAFPPMNGHNSMRLEQENQELRAKNARLTFRLSEIDKKYQNAKLLIQKLRQEKVKLESNIQVLFPRAREQYSYQKEAAQLRKQNEAMRNELLLRRSSASSMQSAAE